MQKSILRKIYFRGNYAENLLFRISRISNIFDMTIPPGKVSVNKHTISKEV